MPIIEAKNISMSYENKKVIDSLTFTVNSGDYLCIVGENGSGKTTLLKGLTGLKKIDSGVLLFGEGLKHDEIGYLPQQTDFQRDFPASAGEVVLSGCINSLGLQPFYGKKHKKMASDAMAKLEISELSNKCYHDLSGGQQQKVLLARAICASKRLLILDEPTTGLDMGASEEMYKFISKLNKEGMTVITISHDVENAVRCANKVLHLGEHEPLFFGDSKEYTYKFVNKGEAGL